MSSNLSEETPVEESGNVDAIESYEAPDTPEPISVDESNNEPDPTELFQNVESLTDKDSNANMYVVCLT
jgi:hypothetical protein